MGQYEILAWFVHQYELDPETWFSSEDAYLAMVEAGNGVDRSNIRRCMLQLTRYEYLETVLLRKKGRFATQRKFRASAQAVKELSKKW